MKIKAILASIVCIFLFSGHIKAQRPPTAVDPTKAFYVEASGIRTLNATIPVLNELRKIPYLVLGRSPAGKWDLRLKPNLGRTKLVIERDGFWKVAEIDLSDPKLVASVSTVVHREDRWFAVKRLERSDPKHTVLFETRMIPAHIKEQEDGTAVLTETGGDTKRRTEVANKRLALGDVYYFEVRNTGKTRIYPTMVDLSPDGAINVDHYYAIVDGVEPDGNWHRISQLYRATPPVGIEVFKIIASTKPIDLLSINQSPTDRDANKVDSPLATLSQSVRGDERAGLADRGVDWAADTLEFEVGRPATLHVLSIGIDNAKEDNRLSTKPDVSEFSELLEEYGAKVFDRVNVKLLFDNEATTDGILKALKDIREQSKPQDTFVFQYCGLTTSIRPKSGENLAPEAALVPFDFKTSSSLSIRTIQSQISLIQANKQFVVMDGSHSTGGLNDITGLFKSEVQEFEGLLVRDIWVFDLANRSTGFEVSVEGVRRGATSYSMIRGMQGEADQDKDGTITVGEICSFAKMLVTSKQPSQENAVWSTGKDFPLLSNPKAARKFQGFDLRAPGYGLPLVSGGPFAEEVAFDQQESVLQPMAAPTPTPISDRGAGGGTPVDEARPPYERKGKDYALFIATETYDNWGPLKNPVFDAREMMVELKDYYGFSIDPTKDLLINPKKSDVLNALRAIKSRPYMPDDQLFIFVAGHGFYDEVSSIGYTVFRDGALPDRADTACEACETYLAHSKLMQFLEAMDCRHIMLVIDSCFSGTAFERIRKRGPEDPPELAANPRMIERILNFRSRLLVTSGGKEYVPDGRPGQHSPFARQFLAALRTYGGGDGLLTTTSIQSKLQFVEPLPLKGEFGTSEAGADFFFAVAKKR